jgi:hypothetical protein
LKVVPQRLTDQANFRVFLRTCIYKSAQWFRG